MGKTVGITAIITIICNEQQNVHRNFHRNFFFKHLSESVNPRVNSVELLLKYCWRANISLTMGTRCAVIVYLTFKCRRCYKEYCIILSAFRRFIWFGSLYLGCASGPLNPVINTEQTKMNSTRSGENIIVGWEGKRRNFLWDNVIYT